jgi:hypothetical protein
MQHGTLRRVAADLGVSYRDVTDHLWKLRTRIGVDDNRQAVAWLDVHEPDWRREDASSATVLTRRP